MLPLKCLTPFSYTQIKIKISTPLHGFIKLYGPAGRLWYRLTVLNVKPESVYESYSNSSDR